ncbi:MAG: hypothetical protein UT54_C0025G0001, partial [Candidatus Daviesbacteria bacterium GW2011_GWB1_39_5]
FPPETYAEAKKAIQGAPLRRSPPCQPAARPPAWRGAALP